MRWWIALTAVVAFASRTQAAPPALSDPALLDEIQRRACLYFWEQADPTTGLANDRARSDGGGTYSVASTASTGYALAALPIAVEHGWRSRAQAEQRALTTLRYLHDRLPNEHGWFYHFVERATGERRWSSEVSSIDTGLLVLGALACGEYFGGETLRLANALYDRLDWAWMLTNGGTQKDKRVLSHGWKPESGFIQYNWDAYSEGIVLYLLGMGAGKGALPAGCWSAWQRRPYRYAGLECLASGPIFLHQMPYAYYDLRGNRDGLGYDFWLSATNAMRIDRQFCIDHMRDRKTYGPNVWGLNASDGPKGYRAYGVPDPEDGTVSPTGAAAAITFLPEQATAAVRTMYASFGDRAWARYGFANALNVDADWYDTEVIGIDLGMALLAIENHRTGLVWRLMGRHPSTRRALAAAGFTASASPALPPRSGALP